MKRYILLGGNGEYPGDGIEDFIDSFDIVYEAEYFLVAQRSSKLLERIDYAVLFDTEQKKIMFIHHYHDNGRTYKKYSDD